MEKEKKQDRLNRIYELKINKVNKYKNKKRELDKIRGSKKSNSKRCIECEKIIHKNNTSGYCNDCKDIINYLTKGKKGLTTKKGEWDNYWEKIEKENIEDKIIFLVEDARKLCKQYGIDWGEMVERSKF